MANIYRYRVQVLSLLFVLLCLSVMAVLQFLSKDAINQLDRESAVLYQYGELIRRVENVENKIALIESSQRGYILSGDEKYLYQMENYKATIVSNLQLIKEDALLQDEKELLERLEYLVNEKLRFVDEIITIYKRDGHLESLAVIKTGKGFRLMQEIIKCSSEIAGILDANAAGMIARNENSMKRSRTQNNIALLVIIIVSLLYLIFFFRELNARLKMERNLKAANKKANEINVLKEQFMANMSHEIRTPLNAIVGFTSMLERTKVDKDQLEYVNAIKTSGSNLLNIINDILDYSKIEAGMLRIESIPLNIQSLVSSLEIMFNEKAREKNIGFTVKVDPRIPETVMGDPTRLTQILVNVVNNAIKFTSKGLVSVVCTLKSQTRGQIMVTYSIKDTGIGMTEEQQKEVFQRFIQASSETTRQFGGTGLGLSIVKNLVELQHGTLALHSREGEGSEFIIELPYMLPAEEKTKKGMVVTPAEDLEKRKTEGKIEVLLVEDNILNQKYESAILKQIGMEVDIANNGQVALEMLKTKTYNIILMDIQMPILDGYKAATKIRGELNLDTPIIAMTAHVMQGEREKCIGYGMNDYISKPFKESDLLDLIYTYASVSASTSGKPVPKSEEVLSIPSKKDRLTNLAELKCFG